MTPSTIHSSSPVLHMAAAPTMEALVTLTNTLHGRLDHVVQLLQKIANRVPLHRFLVIGELFNRIVELAEEIKEFQKYKLIFSLLQSCKKISEQAFTPLYQSFKVTDSSIWAPIHEIKFPFPPGSTPSLSNTFIIPVAVEVIKKTTKVIDATCKALTDRIVFLTSVPHNLRISSDPEGKVFTTPTALTWEMWKLEDADKDIPDSYYIASIEHDRALSCSQDGSIFTTQYRMSWERWRLEQSDEAGSVFLSNVQHDKRITCTASGTLEIVETRLGFEKWRVERVISDVLFLARQLGL